jgi:hypothetical protein
MHFLVTYWKTVYISTKVTEQSGLSGSLPDLCVDDRLESWLAHWLFWVIYEVSVKITVLWDVMLRSLGIVTK